MKEKIFLLSFVFLFISCSFDSASSSGFRTLRTNRWDEMNIPDSRNCGADESTDFTVLTESGEIADGVYLMLRSDTNQYNLSSYKCPQLPKNVTIRNYDFSQHDFVTNGMDRYKEYKYITFENCRFKGFRNDAVKADSSGKAYFTFNNCTFSGNVNNSYITLNDCKIGGFTSDAMNPLREFYASNLYVYDLAHAASEKEIHLDGIQIYGDQRSRNNVVDGKWISNVETGDIHFDNIRFEIPSINLGANNKAYVNACVMFQLEFSDVNDVSFRNLYVNGGGKWYPLYMDYGKNNERSEDGVSWSHKNLVMENAMVSNNFGTIFYPKLLTDATIKNVDHHDYMFVTSVWKDNEGTVHLLVTNDTNSDKTLTVKSNKGSKEFFVPHCPSNWALGGEIDTRTNPNEELADSEGKLYTAYEFDDLPFDLEFTIPDSPDFIVCYQNDEQIRYVNFNGKKHHFKEITE